MENPVGINLARPRAEFSRPEVREAGISEEKKPQPKFISKVLGAVMSLSIFMIFLGLPLFFTGLSFQGINFEKQIYFYVWILLALVAWAARGVIEGEMKIRKTPLDLPILIFWLIYLLATAFSIDRWHSFWGFFGDPSRGLMSVTALVIMYYLIFSNFSQRLFKYIYVALLTSGSLLAAWTALAVMGVKFLPERVMNLVPLSLVGSVSGLGTIFGALIPLLITAIFKIRSAEKMSGWVKNLLTGLLLLILGVVIFLLMTLYAFVPWVGVLIGVGFFLIFILAQLVRPATSWTWLPMVAFVAVLMILMVGSNKIARINIPTEVSPSYKLSWDIAKNVLKDRFFLGSGPALYGHDFSLYRPQEFNMNAFYNLRFYQGTGLVMEALASLGVVGTIALVFGLLSFISVTIYLLATHKEKDKTYSLGFLTAALIFLYALVTTRAEGVILILGVLVGAVALALLLQETGSEERYLNLSLKASPKFALALAFIFMVISAGVAFLFVFVGKVYLADLYAGRATSTTTVSEDGSIAKLMKAVSLNGREGRYYTRIGQEYMVLANQEILKGEGKTDLEATKRYLNNSIAAANQGKVLMTKDVLAAESLAQVYENAGLYVADSLVLAEKAYQDALALEPHNPSFHLKLGQLKTSQAASKKENAEKKQLVEEAKGLFQKAIDEKANFDAGYYYLALTQEALGDLDGAIENAGKAFSLQSSSLNYAFNLARLYQARGKEEDNKNAETILKQLIAVNDKDINTHFSLGLLYEKTNRKQEAIGEYTKVTQLLPADQAETRERVEKMISNVRNGVENTPANLGIGVEPVQQNQ